MNIGVIAVIIGGIFLCIILILARKEAKNINEKPLTKKEQRRMKRNGI